MSYSHQCPVCHEYAVGKIKQGQSKSTPGQIDDYWRICVGESAVYVHDIGVNDWSDHFGKEGEQ